MAVQIGSGDPSIGIQIAQPADKQTVVVPRSGPFRNGAIPSDRVLIKRLADAGYDAETISNTLKIKLPCVESLMTFDPLKAEREERALAAERQAEEVAKEKAAEIAAKAALKVAAEDPPKKK